MTDKNLERRYPDVQSVVADLEEALAIEAARSGRSTGEATAVLATLPAHARRRLPLRMRRRIPVFAVVALLILAAAATAVLLLQAGDRTERGTGQGTAKPPAGTKVVSVKRTSAQDFDPLGDDSEHSEQARLAVDRDPGTTWTTESYNGATLGAKKGVGLYVDAVPGVAATSIEIDSEEKGWSAEIYGAEDGPAPKGAPPEGWERIGGGQVRRAKQRFTLRTEGTPYRYYLLWITALPPSEQRVEISDIALFAKIPA